MVVNVRYIKKIFLTRKTRIFLKMFHHVIPTSKGLARDLVGGGLENLVNLGVVNNGIGALCISQFQAPTSPPRVLHSTAALGPGL